MTTAPATFDLVDATAAVTLAARAPSIHNTQPWSWILRDGALSLHADRRRQLSVADPGGHSLMISCGAALALTQIGLQAQGWDLSVERVPDPDDPDLLAEFRALHRRPPDARDRACAEAAAQRRSDRRPFAAGAVGGDDVERLRRAGASDEVLVHFPVRAGESLDLAVAVSNADRVLLDDEAYRAELASWVRTDAAAPDGVPIVAVPLVPDGEPRHTDIPLRDFEIGVSGGQLIDSGIDERPLLAIMLTDSDHPQHQLAAGESMMRLMIEAELLGLSSCALSQAVDILDFRARVRALMSWTSYPQMMVRLGPRPDGPPAPMTNRRSVHDMLSAD
ncbi:MAG TPA: hypothetical protein VIJ71_02175 [Mycobacteriales bacterium]